jgi:signal transduction histidine kinase
MGPTGITHPFGSRSAGTDGTMDHTQKLDEQLEALASHLSTRRESILEAWRKAVSEDPQLTAAAALPRNQFNDHIPEVLDGFERKLRRFPDDESAASRAEQKEDAEAHGLHRWQQGYNLRELTREWGHLHLCLLDELEEYGAARPELEPGTLSLARRALAQMCSEGVSESTVQFFQLRQTEAAGHVRDLEQAMAQARQLERQRAELWREAAHDLRGNLGIVTTATTGLTLEGLPAPSRDSFVRLLQRSVSSLHSMLEDVMGLARLEAGHEKRVVAAFDAAALLRELCDDLQVLARERGLFLRTEGPDRLPVEGDAIKTRRIAQNLLLNALSYTREGGATVGWGDSRDNDAGRWMMTVRDTGPGFAAGPGAPLAGALKEATREAREVEVKAGDAEEWNSQAELPGARAAHPPASGLARQTTGEGIGLSIVKSLCELLDASLEMESSRGAGTLFRVILPRAYQAAATDGSAP